MKIEIPTGITTLLLDLGGVLLNLHMKKTYDAFDKLGFANFHQHFDSYKGSSFIEDFEEGKITAATFIKLLQKKCNTNITDEQIIIAWNAMLGELPLHKLETLQQWKTKYQLILYSNTNAIHVNHLHNYYNQNFGINNVQNLFDVIYYSHELGIRKPKVEGFKQIIETHSLQPNQVFYIDDGSMHIATAKALGINTLLWVQNGPFYE